MRDIRDKGNDWNTAQAKWSSLAYLLWPLLLVLTESTAFDRLSDTLLMGWSVLLATNSYMYHRDREQHGGDAEEGIWRLADNIFVDLVAVTLFCAMWGLYGNWAFSIPGMAVTLHVVLAASEKLKAVTALDVAFLLATIVSTIYLIDEQRVKQVEASCGLVILIVAFAFWDWPCKQHHVWHVLSALAIALLWRSTF